MVEMTRRRMLGSAAGVTGAALAASVLPVNVRKALATEPNRPGSLRDIKHVVMLMQENRSFDHYFGTMAGVAGFSDPHAIKLSTGRSVFYQPDSVNPDGYTLPFHLDTRSSSAQAIPSTSHAWDVQHSAWNDGKMDNWLPAHRKADGANGPYVMGYHVRADLPFQFALAEAFTICDHYHCSVFGPTWPNRMMWMTGTVDPNGKNGGPITSNVEVSGGYTWTTYAERLEAAGVSWKVYLEPQSSGYHMLQHFKQYKEAPTSSPLYKKAMTYGPIGQFEYDAMNDNLPTGSWLMTSGDSTEHPNATPAKGAAYVAAKIDAIAANPEVWAKTVFILDYDENDGLFDHVVPPTPKAGTPDEFVGGLPVGGGFRVPCIIVSPWTAGGWVASQNFDHTSVLQFVERITGVKETNISAWRRKTFGDLTSAFRFGRGPAKPPVLPDTSGQVNLASYGVSQLPAPTLPGADQTPPTQEKSRPNNA